MVKFKLNLPGLNELMKSQKMQNALDDAGEKVAQIAGAEYSSSPKTGRYIGFSNVYPDSAEAAKDNYNNNTLIKALNSSGLSLKK